MLLSAALCSLKTYHWITLIYTGSVTDFIRSKIRCECKNNINVIATDIAFELAGRPSPIYYCVDYSSHCIEKVKEWISGKKEQDLVVSLELMKGFEDPLIIDLSGYTVVSSRSSSKIVKVKESRDFAALLI